MLPTNSHSYRIKLCRVRKRMRRQFQVFAYFIFVSCHHVVVKASYPQGCLPVCIEKSGSVPAHAKTVLSACLGRQCVAKTSSDKPPRVESPRPGASFFWPPPFSRTPPFPFSGHRIPAAPSAVVLHPETVAAKHIECTNGCCALVSQDERLAFVENLLKVVPRGCAKAWIRFVGFANGV